MLKSNYLRAALNKGDGPSWGVWQTLPNTNISRMLAKSPGVDWVAVDCEHGQIDDGAMHELVPAIAAAGASPIVRVPGIYDWMIKRALDTGAHGVLVPLLRSVEEAKLVAAAARFPPHGRRGFGTTLPLERFTPAPTLNEYLTESHESLLTMVQIETKEALEQVEEIAAVDGVDVLFVGPFDLGLSIGHPIMGADMPPQLTSAIGRIIEAAHAAGKKCGMFCTTGEKAAEAAAQGFDMINVAWDYASLERVVHESLKVAQAGGKNDG